MNDNEILEVLKELHKISKILVESGNEKNDQILSRIGATIELMLLCVARDDFEEMMYYIGMFLKERKKNEKAVENLLKGINLN